MTDTTTLAADIATLAEAVDGLQQLALDDKGWTSLSSLGDTGSDLSHEQARKMADLCEMMTIANPLIRRGFALRKGWIWGDGINVGIATAGDQTADVTSPILQRFLADNAGQLYTSGAYELLERHLYTRGAICTLLHCDDAAKRVTVRIVDRRHIADVITNPDDVTQRWFYKRTYSTRTLTADGSLGASKSVTVWHPDIDHRPAPADRLERIQGKVVRWDQPMHVAAVNLPAEPGTVFGIPDAYPALAWARMSKEFLEAWFLLTKALSRYAWRTTTRGSKVQAAARKAVAAAQVATPSTPASPGGDVGAHAFMSTDSTLEAIPKTGASIDANSGRPLQEMVTAALDVPLAQLIGNTSTGENGSRAALAALDQPTEMVMGARREFWTAWFRKLGSFALDQAAEWGAIPGASVLIVGGRRQVTYPDGVATNVAVSWPAFDSLDLATLITALETADQMDKLPPLWVAQQLVRALADALHLDDVDEILAQLDDGQGNLVPPAQRVADALQARDNGDQ